MRANSQDRSPPRKDCLGLREIHKMEAPNQHSRSKIFQLDQNQSKTRYDYTQRNISQELMLFHPFAIIFIQNRKTS